jgi:putative FmdB family regulatory protein
MPLYEYKCECGYEGEELVQSSDAPIKCRKCGAKAERKMSRFASVISGGSPVETIDMTIGRDADKRWKVYGDQRTKRHGDRPLQTIAAPKDEGGKYKPMEVLGTAKEKADRKEFSTALQEHRKHRSGAQFDGPGF